MAVHAISGAAGEIVQISALYPLDTLKVSSWSVRVVLLPSLPSPLVMRARGPKTAADASRFGCPDAPLHCANGTAVSELGISLRYMVHTILHASCRVATAGTVPGARPEDVGAAARAPRSCVQAVSVHGTLRRPGDRSGGVGCHWSLLPPQVGGGRTTPMQIQ